MYANDCSLTNIDEWGELPRIKCPRNRNIGKVRTAINRICDALKSGKLDQCDDCATGPKQLQCLKDFCERGTVQCGSRLCVRRPNTCGHAKCTAGEQHPERRVVICNVSFEAGQCEGKIVGHPVTDTLLHEMMHVCGSFIESSARNKAGACIQEMLK